jgi:hypothetical protein
LHTCDTLTEYDDLLAQGYDVESAMFFVAADIDVILNSWGVRRKLTAAKDDPRF